MFPIGVPAASHVKTVSRCSSESDRSFLNLWMPTVRSMCHGGIWREATLSAMDLAHGRARTIRIRSLPAAVVKTAHGIREGVRDGGHDSSLGVLHNLKEHLSAVAQHRVELPQPGC